MGRLILAALLGGSVSFAWGYVSHSVLGLGEQGIEAMPDEPALLALFEGHPEGAYPFPWIDWSGEPDMQSPEYMDWAQRYTNGPTGMVLYRPEGTEPMGAMQFGVEFLSGVLASLLMALVLISSRCGYLGRWGLCVLMGLFAYVAVVVPWWNWWRFPTGFSVGALSDTVLAAAVVGVVLAAVARPPRVTSVPMDS